MTNEIEENIEENIKEEKEEIKQQNTNTNTFQKVYLKNLDRTYRIEIDETYIKCFTKEEKFNLQIPLEEFGYVKNTTKLFQFGRITKIIYIGILVLLVSSIIFMATNIIFLALVFGLIFGLKVLYDKQKLKLRFYVRDVEEKACYSMIAVFKDENEKNRFYKVLKEYNKIGFCQFNTLLLDFGYFKKLMGN